MNQDIELTRRKILAGIGAAGVASVGAGLGTSAYFSDTESFGANTIAAGELDLKVDWEEHYNYPQLLGFDDPTTGLEYEPVTDLADIPEGTDESAWKPFPPGTSDADDTPEPLIYVYDGNDAESTDVDLYMDNTAIEAFPDDDNDGTGEFPIDAMLPDLSPCEVLADVGGEEGGDLGKYTTAEGGEVLGRTDNDDTRLDDESPAPLINMEDVKPGDFGEVTFSTHLCDNPGYLWMQMPGGLTLDEGGVTDPESESDEEEDGTVELPDEVQTAIWYDNNCDNLVTRDEKLDIMAVADTSDSIEGSLSEEGSELDTLRDAANVFVDFLPEDQVGGEDRVRAGLMTMNGPGDSGGEGVRDQPALRAGIGSLSQFDTDGDGNADIGDFLPEAGQGGTPVPYALDLARKVLQDQGRSDARQVILLVTDGLPDYVGTGDSILPYVVEDPDTGATYTADEYDGSINGSTTCTELDETGDVANDIKGEGIDILGVGIALGDTDCDEGSGNIAGDTFLMNRVVGLEPSPGTAEPNQFFDVENYDDLEAVAEDVGAQLVGGEGTGDQLIFQGTLREAESVLTAGDGVALDADRDAEGRQCFQPSNTHCFGFSWWLPPDVGNHVQTDSAAFDIAFYSEQCRHNDGETA
ncbi:vWA domain-containing protein [Haloarchaeobius iranensis]|uniref:SipW-cognate class signal peptide n=1 Tax=Haloarchaeobius iranensis TaxID=996166 RepID=A0A1G9YHK4_9EURY|nr:vWA domain-containing protein [Haloarchaeobius iranensis]SDN08056.1 SipW-cognate class signal peptide [Haloarchaeobius iranensis]